jgi:hypothetical protein
MLSAIIVPRRVLRCTITTIIAASGITVGWVLQPA